MSTGNLHPWIYGYYHYDKVLDRHYICDDDTLFRYEVIGETVGQYTGMKDKNGVEICEGDKVTLSLYFYSAKDAYTAVIIYKKGAFFADGIMDIIYNEPRCDYREQNSIVLYDNELYDRVTREYIPNYGEVFTLTENAVNVEVTGTIHNHLLTPTT